MSGPTPTGEIVRPRNPYIGFAFAAAWALVAVSGIIVLLIDGERVVTGQISGQRSVGLFLITPAIGVVLGIIALVRASVAVRPWGAYLAATTPEQRQALSDSHFSKRSFTPLLLAGLAVAAGWLVILAFVIAGIETASTAGLSALVMVLTLLGMAGATLISVGVRGNAAFRRSQGR